MNEYADIDQYIAMFPEDTRTILETIRATIRREAPGAEEAIRYGIPTFRLGGRNLVHFAAFKDHTGFFPTPSGIEKFSRELSPYTTSKGTVQFPNGTPVPYDLIAKIVRFRAGESMSMRAKNRKKPKEQS
ncbi:MAG: hypothetical protein CW742_12400 [Methanoregula sp.]|nr:MAG: hypothetical protein CW742_12400 [Methanoregula sp.]